MVQNVKARGVLSSATVPITARRARSNSTNAVDPDFCDATYADAPFGAIAMLCGLATATRPTTVSLDVSMNTTCPASKTATSNIRPSGVNAMPCGAAPTSIVSVTLSVRVSITLTTVDPSLLTNTRVPSRVMAIPCGPVGTAIVDSTRSVTTSITATVLSLKIPAYALMCGLSPGLTRTVAGGALCAGRTVAPATVTVGFGFTPTRWRRAVTAPAGTMVTAKTAASAIAALERDPCARM